MPRRPPKSSRKAPTLARVLVAEDDPIQALALEDALLAAGVGEVVICPSTADMMAALEQGPADAVVLDVHLEDRSDGWAVAELVDLLGPKRPMIAFSTGSPEAIPADVAEMGPIFEKPYDPAQLALALTSGAKKGLFAKLRGVIG